MSFITFQKLEKDCGDDFMGAAIEYAETYKLCGNQIWAPHAIDATLFR